MAAERSPEGQAPIDPPGTAPASQTLRLLSLFHFVLAGLTALFSLFPLIHVAVGAILASGVAADSDADFPFALVGWSLLLFGAAACSLGLSFSACLAFAGRSLALRRHRTFCLVAAGAECLLFPLGTLLGALTLVFLLGEEGRKFFPET